MSSNNQLKPTLIRGTCFVLHSTKSSPATSDDLAKRYAFKTWKHVEKNQYEV